MVLSEHVLSIELISITNGPYIINLCIVSKSTPT